METVFVVTAGEYSDYHIVGVFDDEPLAQQCAKLVGGTVGVYPINQERDRLNAGLTVWYALIDLETGEIRAGPYQETQVETEAPWLPAKSQSLHLQVWARDAAHAVKIAGEQRREWLVTHPASVEHHDS